MFQMDDEIAFVQLAEIDLRAVAAEIVRRVGGGGGRAWYTGRKVRPPERTTSLAIGKDETARERPFEELDAGDRLAHDFAEALDFAFGLEIDHDRGTLLLANRADAR